MEQARKAKKWQSKITQIDTWIDQNDLSKHYEHFEHRIFDDELKELFAVWSPGTVSFWRDNRMRSQKDIWFLNYLCHRFIPRALGTQNDLEESESISKSGNVTFVNERPIEAVPSHISGDKEEQDSHTEISEIPWTVKQLLERELLISTVTWKVGDVGNLLTEGLPKTLVKSGSVVENQLRLCGFLRALS